ncbi:hypothetical protein Tco_0185461 [Tanacetum coccineum]
MDTNRATRSTPVTENPTTTTVTNAQFQAMIDQGVTAALTARDANKNGDDSHTSGTCARRTERVTRECTYQEFIKSCSPLVLFLAGSYDVGEFPRITLEWRSTLWHGEAKPRFTIRFTLSKLEEVLMHEPLAVPLDRLHFDDKLHFVEEPIEIIDREVKRLKRSRIPLVKVRWNSKRGPEFTWEREDQFKETITPPRLHQGPHRRQVLHHNA